MTPAEIEVNIEEFNERMGESPFPPPSNQFPRPGPDN
jgi:hypothetical protein